MEVVKHPEISKWRTPGADLELRKDLQEKGQIQNLVFRRLPDGRLELLSGGRRFDELLALGVPPEEMEKKILENVSDEDAIFMAYSENRFRRDFEPIEEARAFDTMRTVLKVPPSDIAVKTGRSESYVRERLALLRLPAKIQGMIEKGKLALSYARPLGRLEGYTQVQLDLAKEIVDTARKGYGDIRDVDDAEKWVERFLATEKHRKDLVKRFGPCPKCESEYITEHWGKALVCRKCQYAWHRETGEPWQIHELKEAAARLGLKLDVKGADGAELTPKEMLDILKEREETKREEVKKFQKNFRSEHTVREILLPLITEENLVRIIVEDDEIEILLVHDTGMNFSARHHDYKTGEKAQVKVREKSWDKEVPLEEAIRRVRDYVARLGDALDHSAKAK